MKAAAVLHKNAPAAPASPLAHPSGSPMHAAGPLGAGAPAVDEEEASDYTDADESISAPTEFLAEFLSAIMGKDYPTALKYCKLILQYEPNNRTAREFYPLIVEKLVQSTIDEARTDSEDESSSGGSGSLTGSGSDDEDSGSDLSDDEDDEDDDDEEGEGLEPRRGQEHNDNSSAEYGDTDGTTASYSSLEDEEADPADSTDTAGMANDNEDVENGNQEYLQVLHDAQLANKVTKLTLTTPGTAAPGAAARCSDSESPTEPVSQQLVADLRARALPAASVPASPARAGQAGRR